MNRHQQHRLLLFTELTQRKEDNAVGLPAAAINLQYTRTVRRHSKQVIVRRLRRAQKMMQQQARTVSVSKSSRFEHAADIRFDVLRIKATNRVETDLAKEPRTMAQPSIQNDAGCVVERRPLPLRSNARRPSIGEINAVFYPWPIQE